MTAWAAAIATTGVSPAVPDYRLLVFSYFIFYIAVRIIS
ncbi:hypothetical protein CFter6_0286 [Collimonas fungivorans]|jgi:hypothetical protein|uniref:Uncharacterized protein n=1 Tax=Collimonas fungivorans TaxID=158899 RepID=A0A127P5Q7_9BURK|nr:hypothetical protein CFter6_0286 [Collimonas fungivorans]